MRTVLRVLIGIGVAYGALSYGAPDYVAFLGSLITSFLAVPVEKES